MEPRRRGGDGSRQLYDPSFNPPLEERRKKIAKGWTVSRLPDRPGEAHPILSTRPGSALHINTYQIDEADEMHCHPDEDHLFLVWKGVLHLTGIGEGEDVTLGPGEFVHIDAGYYYRLHNPGPEVAMYCQFRTLPDKPAKRRRVFYEESARGKEEAMELQGAD